MAERFPMCPFFMLSYGQPRPSVSAADPPQAHIGSIILHRVWAAVHQWIPGNPLVAHYDPSEGLTYEQARSLSNNLVSHSKLSEQQANKRWGLWVGSPGS